MPRKDSETLPADLLERLQNKEDSPPPQFTISSSPSNKKPNIAPLPPSSDLLSRLNAFLPAISAANRDLESEIAAGTVDSRNIENVDVTKDEAYIEMNLGLGVLKELKSRRPGDPESSESESESEPESGSDGGEGEDAEEGDVLAKLLNGSKRHGKGPRGKPSIQEVEDAASTPTPVVDTEMEEPPKAS